MNLIKSTIKILYSARDSAAILIAVLLVIIPMMSLTGGGQDSISKYEIERDTKSIRQEIKAIKDTISVIDAQIKYKDSVDFVMTQQYQERNK